MLEPGLIWGILVVPVWGAAGARLGRGGARPAEGREQKTERDQHAHEGDAPAVGQVATSLLGQ
jgi:hypothetical protein